jgi:hypothetical protein
MRTCPFSPRLRFAGVIENGHDRETRRLLVWGSTGDASGVPSTKGLDMFRTQQRAASGIAVFALLATLALAGCAPTAPTGVASLDGGTGSTSSPQATDEPSQGDQVKFAECMREHGIDMPDPDPSEDGGFGIMIPQGTSKEAADAAIEACKEFMPNGGEPPHLNAEELAAMREFAKCMRENGIENFPDPSADGGIAIEANPDDPDGIDPESQEFKNAEDACKDLMPEPPDGSDEGPSMQIDGGES